MAVRSFNSRSTGAGPSPVPGPAGTGGSAPGKGRRWLKPRDRILLVAVVVLTIAVVVAALTRRGHDDAATPGATSTTSKAAPLPGRLGWGTVTAGSAAGTSEVYGVPTGFPHTQDGGIAAAVNYTGADAAQPTWNTAQAPAIYKAVFAPNYLADTTVWDAVKQIQEQIRAKYSLNDAGQVVTGGVVDPSQVFLSRCDQRFGAYRPVTLSADKVVVDVWGPCVLGVAAALPSFQGTTVGWVTARTTVEWTGSAWQVTASGSAGEGAPKEPAGDRQTVPPTYATRAATVPGEGWLLVKNGVETFDPVTEWATGS